MTSKVKFLTRIGDIPKYGSGICLQRVELLINAMVSATYLEQTPKIVITGTDGKGSTATLVESILRASGSKTGLFTSPHFLEFNERFKVSNNCVSYPLLLDLLTELTVDKDRIENQLNEVFGVFEVLFVLALATFERQNVQLLIFEAGIGGRYDPVRLLRANLTALTSVALEHTDLLGDSTELIAYDKLDACFPGGTTVAGNISPALFDKINACASLRDVTVVSSSTMVTVSKSSNSDISLRIDGVGQTQIITRLTDKPQLFNIQTAVALSIAHFNNTLPSNFISICQQGIEHCHIPGRFELINQSVSLYVDAAHTPAAYDLLFDTIELDFDDKPLIIVTGISQGRDNQSLVSRLETINADIIVTQAHFKGAPASQLYQAIQNANSSTLQANLSAALTLAKQKAKAVNGRIFVIGGLFLAGEAAAIEKNIDIEQLYLY